MMKSVNLNKCTEPDESLTGRLTVADSLSVNWGRPDSSSGESITIKAILTRTDGNHGILNSNRLQSRVRTGLCWLSTCGLLAVDSPDYFFMLFLSFSLFWGCLNKMSEIALVREGSNFLQQKYFSLIATYDLTFAQSWDHYKSFLNFYDLWFLKAPGFSSNITQMSCQVRFIEVQDAFLWRHKKSFFV